MRISLEDVLAAGRGYFGVGMTLARAMGSMVGFESFWRLTPFKGFVADEAGSETL